MLQNSLLSLVIYFLQVTLVFFTFHCNLGKPCITTCIILDFTILKLHFIHYHCLPICIITKKQKGRLCYRDMHGILIEIQVKKTMTSLSVWVRLVHEISDFYIELIFFAEA